MPKELPCIFRTRKLSMAAFFSENQPEFVCLKSGADEVLPLRHFLIVVPQARRRLCGPSWQAVLAARSDTQHLFVVGGGFCFGGGSQFWGCIVLLERLGGFKPSS